MRIGSSIIKLTSLPEGGLKMYFHGANAYFLEQYIAFSRNMGYALKDIYKFRMFDLFTIENGVTPVGLTRELADKWAEKRPNESESNRYKRVNDITNYSTSTIWDISPTTQAIKNL
jgi:hypothetical protein